MGYILPVTPYTYTNYHYRITDKHQPHQINASYKVIFHKIEEMYDFHKKNYYPKANKMKEGTKTVPLHSFQVDEKTRVKLTGKGKSSI